MTDTVAQDGGQQAEQPAPPRKPIDTSFLDQAVAPPDVSDPGAPPVYQGDFRSAPPPAPRYYPGPQAPYYNAPPRPEEDELNAMVSNTRGYVQGLVNEAIQNSIAPVVGNFANQSSRMNEYLQTTANSNIMTARNNLDQLVRDVLSEDEDFMSDERLQDTVKTTLGRTLASAANRARGGDFREISLLTQWTPNHAKAALMAAKTLYGAGGSGRAPAYNPSATFTEGPSTMGTDTSVDITPDEEQVIAARERVEPGFRDRFIAQKKIAMDRGDWEF